MTSYDYYDFMTWWHPDLTEIKAVSYHGVVQVELSGEQEDGREDPHYLVSVTTQEPGQATQHRTGNK